MLLLGIAPCSAGRLCAAAHTTPQPTADIVLLSGSLLHLDLCINLLLCLPPFSLSSFLFFPLPWRWWTQNVDANDHSDGLGASVLLCVVTAVLCPLATYTASPHICIVGHLSGLYLYIHVHIRTG